MIWPRKTINPPAVVKCFVVVCFSFFERFIVLSADKHSVMNGFQIAGEIMRTSLEHHLLKQR